MESKDYLKDLSEIKDLMNKSSRFISLSGLSGILAGIYALIGAALAYWLVTSSVRGYLILDGTIFRICIFILLMVAFLSIVTGIVLTTRKAKKQGAGNIEDKVDKLIYDINFQKKELNRTRRVFYHRLRYKQIC